MLQFRAISGNRQATVWDAEGFPVQIGRAANADIRLEEAGVWDQHAQVTFDAEEGFILQSGKGASTRVNGETIEQIRLRNGDIIEVGSVKLQCWLSEVKRQNLAWREKLVWAILILVTVLQLILIGKLL
ncbi:MAG: Inner rane component of cytoplasmic domain [Verrucomicrobia bacterium]|jgi:pSer/pThr/pTyr-binding forkhead associated (FHA) protein|nr:Inner rane component of cytoplasmic domain [Verrucomicrobiota bacterium]